MEKSEAPRFSMVSIPLAACMLHVLNKTFASETTECNIVLDVRITCCGFHAKKALGFNTNVVKVFMRNVKLADFSTLPLGALWLSECHFKMSECQIFLFMIFGDTEMMIS